MALILRKCVAGYLYVMDQLADPRSEGYFLVRQPLPLVAVFGAYLYLALVAGPRLMRQRPPLALGGVIIAYNLAQVLANAYVFLSILPVVLRLDPRCAPIDGGDTAESARVVRMFHYYLLLKLADLLDTAFFILRKKLGHVSFLHVYHHAGMLIVGWVPARFYPGGQVLYLHFFNTFVHAAMYLYYLLTAVDSSVERSRWWKKYITQLQLVQFLLIIMCTVMPLVHPNCAVPKVLLFIFLPHNVVIIFLFSEFYYKTYIRTRTKELSE